MKKRLTVENDDRASMFAVSDLLWLHEKVGIPIVFDFHVSSPNINKIPVCIVYIKASTGAARLCQRNFPPGCVGGRADGWPAALPRDA